MRYLSGEDVLAIHHYILETTGGSHGVRDVGLFLSILEKPKQGVFGKELYTGVFTKAAALFEAFVNFHVFVDGNKRTGFAVAVRMIERNSSMFSAMNTAVEKFVLRVATEKLSIETIADWLKRHCHKIR